MSLLLYIEIKLCNHDTDWNDKEFGEPGWWKDLFECADEDGNGSLSELELNE